MTETKQANGKEPTAALRVLFAAQADLSVNIERGRERLKDLANKISATANELAKTEADMDDVNCAITAMIQQPKSES